MLQPDENDAFGRVGDSCGAEMRREALPHGRPELLDALGDGLLALDELNRGDHGPPEHVTQGNSNEDEDENENEDDADTSAEFHPP